MKRRWTLSLLCLSGLALQLWGAESPSSAAAGESSATAQPSSPVDDLKGLRERITRQESEIKRLQESMEQQKALLDRALRQQSEIQAAVAVAPASEPVLANASANSNDNAVQLVPAINAGRPHGWAARQNLQAANPSPLAIRIGDSTFTPLGFVDATYYGRSSNVGSGIGTNFGGIPFNNSAIDHISENSFSTQNSRIGFRVDSTVLGAKVLGYFEADFLGNQPGNVFVTSNADTFRMRNVFVDVNKNGFEVLGGQDWSMATPNRKGLSPLPADIFYTQNMDTNYQAGLVWSRQTQFRFIAHPNENVAFGVSIENPQQYIGGSGGLSATAVTLPAAAALSGLSGSQINNGGTNFAAANLHPDIIFKGAYDATVGNGKVMHVEAGAIVRSFKDSFPTGAPVSYRTSTVTAASGEVNANLEVVKNFRIIANTFFGSGNGRYVFGLAPDVIIRGDGSLSPVHTYSTVDGFELNVTKNTLIDAYYGGIYIGRNTALDANGTTRIGYGVSGAAAGVAASDNRTIQEGTFGLTQTFWKSPNYGALSLITQYSYLSRNPWYVAIGAPKATHTNMYWIDLRYTLP